MFIKFVSTVTLFCIAAYAAGAVTLYVLQRKMLYAPSPEYSHQFDGLELHNEQEVLKIIVLNPGQPQAMIYFGGNAEAVIFNAELFLENFPDYTIYLANYRGYGGSTGSPTEQGLYSDALALYDQIHTSHNAISLMGRSLGSGVATYLASEREASHLALITPYDSIRNVAQTHYPFYPVGLMIKDEFDSVEKAASVSAPVLIMMAEHDSIIPNSHSIKLSEAFQEEQVSITNIKDAGHNNLSLDAQYYSTLKRFFGSY